MNCQYGYYDNNEPWRPHLKCNINKQNCPYVKLCTKVDKFIQIDNFREDECYIMTEYKKSKIPNGSNYVRFVRGNYVYIEKDNQVIKVKSDKANEFKDFAYVKEDIDGTYLISTEPFKEVKSTSTYSRKKMTE